MEKEMINREWVDSLSVFETDLLKAYLDIDIADSVAFGDAANDLTMLDTAGLSIVMENADDETKKHADRICPSNNEDGVRKALEELFHIS